ncbi:MAG TPA: hypothetical protein VHS09_00180, partial [Polyangiaceae bacterium]|nr:hypothetical protein [Polyangiaceae bacterium]
MNHRFLVGASLALLAWPLACGSHSSGDLSFGDDGGGDDGGNSGSSSGGSSSSGSSGSSSGSSSGGTAFDGGGVSGSIGNDGGTLSSLYFGVVGDTRPPNEDDVSAYPTTIIQGIFKALAQEQFNPPFILASGDYQFS